MGTYVMSDIHGHKDEFDEMLSKISFGDDDELYILGDIMDKGPKSAEMLMWATTKAGSNVHFLRGNHEDMARLVLERDPVGLCCLRYDDVWRRNKACDTLDQLEERTDGEWRRDVLLPWMDSLEPFTFVNVGGKDFALVHAGFNPSMYEDRDPDFGFIDFLEIDGNTDYGALKKTYELDYGLGSQYSQDMMWIRSSWIFHAKPAPIETVFGHTYVQEASVKYMEDKGVFGSSGGSGRISHILNRHCIDCGCAYCTDDAIRYDMDNNYLYNLACLRLDDMEEFYVPVMPYTPTD